MITAILTVIFIVALTALVGMCFAVIYATNALIEVRALQNSTHNVQFVPAEIPTREFFDPSNDAHLADEMRRREQKQFDDILEDEENAPLMI